VYGKVFFLVGLTEILILQTPQKARRAIHTGSIYNFKIYRYSNGEQPRASAEKFPGRQTEKTRPKNSTIEPFSTLSVAYHV